MKHTDDLLVVSDDEFDQVLDRRGGDSTKWNKYEGRDILPLWVADMDFRSPAEIIEALRHRVDHGIFGYSDIPESLVEAIVQHLFTRYGWSIRKDWISWVASVLPGVNIAARTTGSEDDPLIIPIPAYHPFLNVPGHAHREYVPLRLVKNRDRWEMDLDELDQTLARTNATMVLLCNPHNPTGCVYSRSELEAFADIVLKHGAFICSDEIHCDLLIQPELTHIPIASLAPDVANSTITLMSPGKTFNMPGLNFGFAVISNPTLRRSFRENRLGMQPVCSPLSMAAAEAGYSHGQAWLKRLLTYLRGNAHIVLQKMRSLEVPMTPVEATFLAWLDIREFELKKPVQYFERYGIGLHDGRDFGDEGFVRLNFGCSRSTLSLALERFEEAVNAIRQEPRSHHRLES